MKEYSTEPPVIYGIAGLPELRQRACMTRYIKTAAVSSAVMNASGGYRPRSGLMSWRKSWKKNAMNGKKIGRMNKWVIRV